jgi:ankyrin repeat protein
MPFDIKQESEFIQICADGRTKEALDFLQKDPSLANIAASNGAYPLMFAAQGGSVEVIDAILGCKADINAIATGDELGYTALFYAAWYEQWAALKYLIIRGATNPNASQPEGANRGITVLWLAAYYGQWDVVGEFLNRGDANPNACPAEGPCRGETVLWLAAFKNQRPLVKKLLEQGVAVNPDASPAEGRHQGKTAVWFAIKHCDDDIFRLLLNKGTSIELLNNALITRQSLLSMRDITDGFKPVSYTIDCTLRAAIALFEIIDNMDTGDCITTDTHECVKGILKELCKTGVPALNARFNGKTALHVAIEKKLLLLVEELVINGANLLLPDDQNQTAQSLSDLPIVQTFASLQECTQKLDKILNKSQNQCDSKEELENLSIPMVIKSYKEKILELSSQLKQEHQDILFFKLGELMERALPHIPEAEIEEIFQKISTESKTLYPQAKAKLLHYAMVPKNSALADASTSGLDEKSTSEESMLELACLAGRDVEPLLFANAVIKTFFGTESQERYLGRITEPDSNKALAKILGILREELHKPKNTPSTASPQTEVLPLPALTITVRQEQEEIPQSEPPTKKHKP